MAVGDSALYNNGVGAFPDDNIEGIYEAHDNTAIGSKSLYSNTRGTANTAVEAPSETKGARLPFSYHRLNALFDLIRVRVPWEPLQSSKAPLLTNLMRREALGASSSIDNASERGLTS